MLLFQVQEILISQGFLRSTLVVRTPSYYASVQVFQDHAECCANIISCTATAVTRSHARRLRGIG